MTSPLRIVVFKWGTKYTKVHVTNMGRMLSRNVGFPWEYVVIGDNPRDVEGLELGGWCVGVRFLRLWDEMSNVKLCGVRIKAFSSGMFELIGPRFVWFDLDMVIISDITDLLSRSEPFVGLRPPRPPMPYNGSIVMMDAGSRSFVYDEWNNEDYYRLGLEYGKKHGIRYGTVSDEGWMSIKLGNGEPTIGREDGIYYFKHDLLSGDKPLPKNTRIVVMNGKSFDPANPRIQNRCRWIKEHWR